MFLEFPYVDYKELAQLGWELDYDFEAIQAELVKRYPEDFE